jgi:hypothetical protein
MLKKEKISMNKAIYRMYNFKKIRYIKKQLYFFIPDKIFDRSR